MTTSAKRARTVLFVSHSAARNGATLALLQFLAWFNDHSRIPSVVLLRENGALWDDFARMGPTYLFRHLPLAGSAVMRIGALRRQVARVYRGRLARRLRRADIGLVYSNTVTNHAELQFLSFLGCPVITHAHELDYWIRYRSGVEGFHEVRKRTSQFIAVSEAVKRDLVAHHDVREPTIEVIPGFTTQEWPDAAARAAGRARVRAALSVPDDASVVVGSGTLDWYKGIDLFLHVARNLRRRQHGRRMVFLWVGGDRDCMAYVQTQYDAARLDLATALHVTGMVENPCDYFAAADVMALCSRVDAFPLVMLECAGVGVPIVCFQGAGGAVEFVADGGGIAVPYLDVEQMAQAVDDLLRDDERRLRMGQCGARRVRERHGVELAGPRILTVIERHLR